MQKTLDLRHQLQGEKSHTSPPLLKYVRINHLRAELSGPRVQSHPSLLPQVFKKVVTNFTDLPRAVLS